MNTCHIFFQPRLVHSDTGHPLCSCLMWSPPHCSYRAHSQALCSTHSSQAGSRKRKNHELVAHKHIGMSSKSHAKCSTESEHTPAPEGAPAPERTPAPKHTPAPEHTAHSHAFYVGRPSTAWTGQAQGVNFSYMNSRGQGHRLPVSYKHWQVIAQHAMACRHLTRHCPHCCPVT